MSIDKINIHKIKNALKKSREIFFEVLYPSNIYCLGCGTEIENDCLYSLCGDCLQKISWANGRTCSVCGRPLERVNHHDKCGECRNTVHSFDKGIACFQYGDTERNMIKQFKYRGKSYMAEKFADIIYDRLEASDMSSDIITAVPMYKKKERERGYNQAYLLAESASKKLRMRCERDILIRLKNTAPMNKLGSRARRMNLRGAFGITERGRELVKGRRVLLVDDIFTTGATADMCSSLLKEAGASEVVVLYLAAVSDRRDVNISAQ